jgi:AraC-like DNA-binding protein
MGVEMKEIKNDIDEFNDTILQLGFNKTDLQPYESFFQLQKDKGEGYVYQLCHSNGLHITIGDYILTEPVERSYHSTQMNMEIYYFESGKIKNLEKGKKTQEIEVGINLYVNQNRAGKIYYEAHTPIRYVSILLYDQYMKTHIAQSFPEDYLELSQANHWKSHNYNTPELTLIFSQLKQSLLAKEKMRMYYESKVGEILSRIMSNYRNDINRRTHIARHLHVSDLRYLNLVRQTLEKNITTPPSLDQLCKLSGMGQTKLKEAFKLAFDCTIYGYVREARMKRALMYLSDETYSIQDISSFVGFQTPGKFTKAFKDTYGFTPREYRKSLQINLTGGIFRS